MISNEYTTAMEFWSNLYSYPKYPNLLERRLIDTIFVTSILKEFSSVLDIGCGDGSLLLALRLFTGLNKFYGYDISEKMLNKLVSMWGNYKELTVKCTDIINSGLPVVDSTLAMGSFPYIFSDNDLLKIIGNIKSKLLIVRAPCTLKENNEIINNYSYELKANYAAIYRTVKSYTDIISTKFTIVKIVRAYSDDIESKYGTKHYFFVCEKN